jgi:hypothetical protein
MVNQCKTFVDGTSGLPLFFTIPSTSTSSNAPDVPGAAISSNFDRQVHVVGGCREFRIASEDKRNGSDRHWMSSLIRVISEIFFLRCKSLSWAPVETGSQLSQLAKGAFRGSGVTSIHLPASVTFIGERCFCGCGSLVSITFETGSQFSQFAKDAFRESGVTSIHLPASVAVIDEECFSYCGSLTSITHESGTQLSELATWAFCESGVTSIHLPA